MLLDNLKLFISILVGFLISLYFYSKSIEAREPTFYQEPYSLNIINKELIKSAPLIITTLDGTEIEGNVYSTTFCFFNQGKKSIKKENVLKRIEIEISDSTTHIVAFKVLKISREISQISLSRDSLKNNILLIDFSILETGDGLLAQVVYSTNSNPELKFMGIIEGAKNIKGYTDIPITPFQYFMYPSIMLSIFTMVFLYIVSPIFFILRKKFIALTDKVLAQTFYTMAALVIIFTIIFIKDLKIFAYKQSTKDQSLREFYIPESLRN
jgi:hypothetical protein